ncbi:hypothetical protein OH77DRAFT_1403755 [Trametes cingulata]|nr:hypothetical protein OH77DRAFT_1403755 [Trametes cingulata]
MNSRVVLFLITLMALALFASANPVPNPDGVVVKKALKQYDARRGVAKKRTDDYKPSKVYRAAMPAATA